MRRWLIFAVAIPLGAWVLDRLADQIAIRRGESAVTRALRVPHTHRMRRRAR